MGFEHVAQFGKYFFGLGRGTVRLRRRLTLDHVAAARAIEVAGGSFFQFSMYGEKGGGAVGSLGGGGGGGRGGGREKRGGGRPPGAIQSLQGPRRAGRGPRLWIWCRPCRSWSA